MTQDEIIEMARQAGGVADDKTIVMWHSELEAFAKLVAVKEREACLKIQSDRQFFYGNDLADAIRELK